MVTGRDPQVQAAMDRAARELARRLEPYVPDVSRDRLAAEFIEWEHEQGLRYLPPPPQPTGGRPAPPNEEWRRARAALEGDRTDG